MSTVAYAVPQAARVELPRAARPFDLPAGALAKAGAAQGKLFNRNFALLSQAQLVSQFGNQAFTIAMMAWTADATHSATMAGLMMMAGVLPMVVLGPFTGTFVDRHGSKLRIITACDLVSGAAVSLLALGFVAGPDAWRPAMLFAIALVIGVCNAFFDPAINAFVPDLVPRDQIEGANAFRQSSKQVTILTAQGLGGILYALIGPASLFLLDGLSFLFAGASEMMIRTGDRAADADAARGVSRAGGSFFRQSADGFQYVAAQPGMIGFLVTAAVFNALLMPITILLPVFATTSLRADVGWYGFLLAAISAGAIAGCAIGGARRLRLSGSSRRFLLIAGFAALAIALVVLGQVQSRWIALAILFATGVFSGLVNVLTLSIIQRRTSGEFLGRVLGLHATMIRVLVPIGLVAGGAMADLTGRNVPVVYAICGGLALTTVSLLVVRRTTRAFLAAS